MAQPAGFLKETFFEVTRIWLFGKHFTALTYVRSEMVSEFSPYKLPAVANPMPDLPMQPERAERALRRQQTTAAPLPATSDPYFARIYSFSFEGHYYKLPRPLLFLVSGTPVQPQGSGTGQGNPDFFNTCETGLPAKEWNFSDDILAWKVDRKDIAVCLDIEIGDYEGLLLNPMAARALGSRSDMASRSDMNSRGSFRSDMVGPHQNW